MNCGRATHSRVLTVQLLDTWHVGTGRGEGHHLDAVIDLDVDGLPCVPGRMLRGLIRDACKCLEVWEHAARLADAPRVAALFGGLSERNDAPRRQVSSPGCLGVSAARLPPALRQAILAIDKETLAQEERTKKHADGSSTLAMALRMTSFQTALDARTGCAKPESLRGIELAIPMVLEATIELWPDDQVQADGAWRLLDMALPLVLSLGAHKTRGHGRTRLCWASAAGQAGASQ